MSDVGTEATVRVRFLVHEELADQVEQGLREEGATDVERTTEEPGTRFAFIPIAIAAVIIAGGVAKLIKSLRAQDDCRTTIDARGDDIETTYDCTIKDGRIIVVAGDNTKVDIIDAPDVFDVTEVLKAAASATGEAVKKAAEAAGGTTLGPEPATDAQ
jgi:hypothetical protein